MFSGVRTALLQLKRFKVGSKMTIAASAPVLPDQKKNRVAKSPDSLTHLYFGQQFRLCRI
jgi:hypothetical protein